MKDKIIELQKQGKSYNEIKKILNCSKGTISYYLGENQKQKTANRNKERKQRDKIWLTNIKKELVCSICGENRHWVLDFHHKNPEEKEDNISNLLAKTTKLKILEEISKCDILCANCHRDLHYKLHNRL